MIGEFFYNFYCIKKCTFEKCKSTNEMVEQFIWISQKIIRKEKKKDKNSDELNMKKDNLKFQTNNPRIVKDLNIKCLKVSKQID